MIFSNEELLQRATSEFCIEYQVIFYNEWFMQRVTGGFITSNDQRVNLHRVTSEFCFCSSIVVLHRLWSYLRDYSHMSANFWEFLPSPPPPSPYHPCQHLAAGGTPTMCWMTSDFPPFLFMLRKDKKLISLNVQETR